jgi:hypothetical protein
VEETGQVVKEGRDMAFNSIWQVLHLASAIVCGTSGMPQIEWLDDDHVKASINGKAVKLGRHPEVCSRQSRRSKDGVRKRDFI